VAERRCALRLTRRYDASPAEVWRALTDPESLGRWLSSREVGSLDAEAELELALGEDEPVTVRVRERELGRVLELDWDADGDPSTVRFELRPDGQGGTLLVLDHGRLDERVGMRYMDGWVKALERLRGRLDP
jgi:uncharacterized protein YndB with AHSA1/START domain